MLNNLPELNGTKDGHFNWYYQPFDYGKTSSQTTNFTSNNLNQFNLQGLNKENVNKENRN